MRTQASLANQSTGFQSLSKAMSRWERTVFWFLRMSLNSSGKAWQLLGSGSAFLLKMYAVGLGLDVPTRVGTPACQARCS
jgi:hypothetical protein